MKQYFKIVEDGYISLVGTGSGDGEISWEEYETILSAIRNRPVSEPGYVYKLRTDLTWELCEVPPIEEADEEIPDSEALSIILGGEI